MDTCVGEILGIYKSGSDSNVPHWILPTPHHCFPTTFSNQPWYVTSLTFCLHYWEWLVRDYPVQSNYCSSCQEWCGCVVYYPLPGRSVHLCHSRQRLTLLDRLTSVPLMDYFFLVGSSTSGAMLVEQPVPRFEQQQCSMGVHDPDVRVCYDSLGWGQQSCSLLLGEDGDFWLEEQWYLASPSHTSHLLWDCDGDQDSWAGT